MVEETKIYRLRYKRKIYSLGKLNVLAWGIKNRYVEGKQIYIYFEEIKYKCWGNESLMDQEKKFD